MKLNVAYFLIIVFAIVACDQDEPASPLNYNYINETLKNNFSFNQGSNWIYQNQAMDIDSIVLQSVDSGFTSQCPGNECALNEFIKLTYSNLTQDNSFNHYLLSDFTRFNGGGSFGEEGQPIYILNKEEGFKFNGLEVAQRFDSLSISNKTYYNVEKMSVIVDEQFQHEFDYDRDFYFVASVGIIRVVVYDIINGTITWDLTSYNLE